MRCCDCNLVHRLNFKVIRWGRGHKVLFQAFRHEGATAASRRKGVKSMPESKIRKRGGAVRYRTVKKGDKTLKCAIVRHKGPRGGRTICWKM